MPHPIDWSSYAVHPGALKDKCADLCNEVLVLGLCALVALVAGLGAAPQPAEGAFPGDNGKIAFDRSDGIYVMNPDGSGVTKLSPAGDTSPSSSADGKQLIFSRTGTDVFKMNADVLLAGVIAAGAAAGAVALSGAAWYRRRRRLRR